LGNLITLIEIDSGRNENKILLLSANNHAPINQEGGAYIFLPLEQTMTMNSPAMITDPVDASTRPLVNFQPH
jgi:hypothetical protein